MQLMQLLRFICFTPVFVFVCLFVCCPVFAAEIEFLSRSAENNKQAKWKATERSGEKEKRWIAEGGGKESARKETKVTKLRIRHVALGMIFVFCSHSQMGKVDLLVGVVRKDFYDKMFSIFL